MRFISKTNCGKIPKNSLSLSLSLSPSLSLYIYVCVCVCVCVYIYVMLKRNKPDVLHLKGLGPSCVHIQLYNVTLNTIDFHRSGFSSSEVLASLRGPLNVDNTVVRCMWTEQ
jgi:hypothetical protein